MKLKEVESMDEVIIWGIDPLRMYLSCIDGFNNGELPNHDDWRGKFNGADGVNYMVIGAMKLIDELEECLIRLEKDKRSGQEVTEIADGKAREV